MEAAKKPDWVQYDSLDDRREIYELLAKLPPWKRIGFMKWACRQAWHNHGGRTHPYVRKKTLELAEQARTDDSADHRLLIDLYQDIWYLSCDYEVDLNLVILRLVEVVQGRDTETLPILKRSAFSSTCGRADRGATMTKGFQGAREPERGSCEFL